MSRCVCWLTQESWERCASLELERYARPSEPLIHGEGRGDRVVNPCPYRASTLDLRLDEPYIGVPWDVERIASTRGRRSTS